MASRPRAAAELQVASQMDALQQQIGDDRFVLKRLLGKGGMGTVYEALDRARGETVALKTLSRFDPALLARFKHEFRALADVSHPNLIGLYELLSKSELWFFTMELVRGVDFLTYVRPASARLSSLPPAATDVDTRSARATTEVDEEGDDDDDETEGSAAPGQLLSKIVSSTASGPSGQRSGGASGVRGSGRRARTADPARLRPALLQLAEAIDVLHTTGHLHGDIKPSNVLVTPEGRVVVLDFGVITELAASRTSADDAGIAGTPAFMGPEQFVRGVAPTRSSDWYAFGTVLYKALTGALPFRGDTENLARAKQEHAPASVIDLRPDAPPDLAALCMDLLARDPSARPTGAEIIGRLGGAAPIAAPGAASHALDASLEAPVGRENELRALAEALAAAESGRSLPVLVAGRSGMGKSTIVRHFLSPLEERKDVLVLAGRCYERESVPYKTLDSLIDAACRFLLDLHPAEVAGLLPSDTVALARAFPVLRQVGVVRVRCDRSDVQTGAGQLRRRAFAACRELFQNIAKTRTLVLHIDDLQWGDVDSMPLVAELMMRRDARWLVLASYRSEDAADSPALQMLFTLLGGRDRLDETARMIEVERIEVAALEDLARRLLTAESTSPELAPRIAAEAKGNPYLVHEMVRYTASHGGSVPSGTAMSLESVILARVATLSPAARDLLAVVSMAGWRMTQNVAQAASHLESAQRVFVELRAGLFVRTSGAGGADTIETYHDKVRESVVSTLDRARQRAIHLDIAQALDAVAIADRDEHTYALAHHYFNAHAPEKAERALLLNRRAGDIAAKSYAYAQACAYYAQAEEIAEASRIPLDAGFYAQLGEASARAGRMDAAAAAIGTALETSTAPLERANLRLALSKVNMGQLDSRSAVEEASRALVELGKDAARTSVPRLLAAFLTVWWRQKVRPLSVLPSGEDTEDHARARVLTGIYTQHGYASYFQLDTLSMIQTHLQAFAPAFRLGPSRELAEWFAFAGVISAILRRRRWSERSVQRASELVDEIRDPIAGARVAMYRALTMNFAGDPLAAQAEMARLLDERGALLENQDFLTGTADLAWNLMMRGYAAEAWEAIARGLSRAALTTEDSRAAQGHTYRCYAGPTLAMIGRAEEGGDHLRRYEALMDESPDDKWRSSQYLAHRMLFLVESGEIGAPFEETFAAWSKLRASPKRLPQVMKHAFVACADARMRQLERAGPGSRAAAAERAELALRDLSRAASHPTLVAHHLALTGWLERWHGRLDRAQSALDRAEALARRHDGPWVLYRIARERARLALARGDLERARAQHHAARALAEQHGWTGRLKDLAALAEDVAS
jgi:serine/threonine protein kinase